MASNACVIHAHRHTGRHIGRISLHPISVVNQTFRRDPTRTLVLRDRFMRQMDKRFRALKKDIKVSIVDRDCFGIQPGVLRTLAPTGWKAYEFKRSHEKVQGFMAWLEEQESAGILDIIRRPGIHAGVDTPWTDVFIDSAYTRGIRRGRAELRRAGYTVPDWESTPGGIAGLMNQPHHADRIAAIYSRTFEDLKTVTREMNGQVRRRITDGLTTGLARGLAEGKNPIAIARELVKDVHNRVDKIGITRARMIARTEVIRAHHVANIAEYEQAEAEMDVTIMAEWSTAGYQVCEICIQFQLEGPYKLKQIEGLIPAHPNCRCVAIPVMKKKRAPRRKVAPIKPAKPPVVPGPKLKKRPTKPAGTKVPAKDKPYVAQDSLEKCEQWLRENVPGDYPIHYEGKNPYGLRKGTRLTKKKALEMFNLMNAEISRVYQKYGIQLPAPSRLFMTGINRAHVSTVIAEGKKQQWIIPCGRADWSPTSWAAANKWSKDHGWPWDWMEGAELERSRTVRHEWAHILDGQNNWFSNSMKARDLRLQLYHKFDFRIRDISEYAKKNNREWFAEAFSHYTSPSYGQYDPVLGKVRKFPKPLEDYLEEAMDMMRGK